MTEKTFRDELAMSFDPKGYTFDSITGLFAFVGQEFSMQEEALKRASVSAIAKLRYMYADAMMEARKNG